MDTREALREKANKLPLLPGVYIMQNEAGEVIYVGKAKALKNRVTSYFRGEHLPKVEAMVSHVADFSVIVAASEFEALMLENSLIKRHKPHYNILLRDDKTYPFIRVDEKEEYPSFSVVGRTAPDGARYFGPFGGRGVSFSILNTMIKTLKMPSCSKKFPRDIGRDRPCLNWHMGVCEGWCRGEPGVEEYRNRIAQAEQILSGSVKELIAHLEQEMSQASAELRFETAAQIRDRIAGVKELTNKQTVLKAARADLDAVGFYRSARTSFVVLHYTEGDLAGKDLEQMSEPLEEDAVAVSALVRQYYSLRGTWPRQILLPMELEDAEPLGRMLSELAGRKVELIAPQRGIKRELLEAAARNAREESLRSESEGERRSKTLEWLQKMLGLDQDIHRIEAFDISNTGDFGIVASMVVFEDGKPARSQYRKFKMKQVQHQDDFASMHEAVSRRFQSYREGDEKFSPLPDLLLIDGGVGQVAMAVKAMEEQQCSVPVFGMVKDDKHRTRALTTPEGREIGLSASPAVFALIGSIQEETHRTAVSYHKTLRKKTIGSSLEQIPGVGPKRRSELLRQFKSLKAVEGATLEQLSSVVPRNVAEAVYHAFHQGKEESCESLPEQPGDESSSLPATCPSAPQRTE